MRALRLAPIALALCVRMSHADSVTAINGESYEGKVSFDNGIVITPAEGAPVKVEFAAALRLQIGEKPSTDDEAQPGVILRDGTRVSGAFGSFAEPGFKFPRHNLAVSQQDVAWMVYQAFPMNLAEKLPAGGAGVLLPGGDFFEGAVKAADSESVKVMSPIFGLRTFLSKQKDLLAVILRDVKPSAAPIQVRTTDGCLLNAEAVTGDKTGLTLRTAAFGLVKIEAKDIAGLRASPSRMQPLWALKPARIDAPAGQTPPQFAIDKSLSGRALSAWGVAVNHGVAAGVGVVGTWEIPPGFTLLTSEVALPAGSEPDLRLTFAVYTDGKLVFRSAPIGPTDKPLLIHAAIAGSRAVSLRVEPSAPGVHAEGSGIWIEPTLVRR